MARSHSPSRSRSRSARRSPPKRVQQRSRSRDRDAGRDGGRDRDGGRGRDVGRERGRGRSRSRSRDRSPRRGGGRGGDRGRDRSRGRGGDRPVPQSLLVRNIAQNSTADEIRRAFSRTRGDIIDVYLPKEFNGTQLRGFAFIEYALQLFSRGYALLHGADVVFIYLCLCCRFADSRQAREIKREMDRSMFNGQEIAVLFAQQKRKTPDQMRESERGPRRSRSYVVMLDKCPSAFGGNLMAAFFLVD